MVAFLLSLVTAVWDGHLAASLVFSSKQNFIMYNTAIFKRLSSNSFWWEISILYFSPCFSSSRGNQEKPCCTLNSSFSDRSLLSNILFHCSYMSISVKYQGTNATYRSYLLLSGKVAFHLSSHKGFLYRIPLPPRFFPQLSSRLLRWSRRKWRSFQQVSFSSEPSLGSSFLVQAFSWLFFPQ